MGFESLSRSVVFPNHASLRRLTRKRFLETHREAERALRPVVGLMLQVVDAEKFAIRSHRLLAFFAARAYSECLAACVCYVRAGFFFCGNKCPCCVP